MLTVPRRSSFVMLIFVCALLAVLSNGRKAEVSSTESAILPPVTATNVVTITNDGVPAAEPADGKADPGEILEYTVTVSNGGTDATGVQLSSTLQNITTFVGGSVAVSPAAGNDTLPVNVTGNVAIDTASMAIPFSVLTNDFQGLNVTPGISIVAFDAVTTNGGNVVMTTSGANIGKFTYDPPAGFEGADTFTYTLSDNTNAPSPAANRTATVTINVSGMVWFINNNAAACTTNGCGRLSNPYSTLAAFSAANDGVGNHPNNNDNIFIYESATAYTGGVTLRSGQRMIGQDSTASLSTLTGLAPVTGSSAFPAMNTGAPTTTIQNAGGNGVTLGLDNSLFGFTAGNAGSTAISGTTFGTLNVNEVTINTTLAGLKLQTGGFGGSASFGGITSGGGANNVLLSAVTGTANLGGGALSGASSTAFGVVGGTVSFTYSGNVTQASNAPLVQVTGGHSTGTITFQTGTLSATNGNGLQFDNADGTYNLNGTNTLSGSAVQLTIANGSSGSFSLANASITNSGSSAFSLNSSNANITYNGNLTANNFYAVDIDNHDSGTITFQNGSIGSSGASARGVRVVNSNGGVINFNDQVTLSTQANTAVDLGTNNGGGTVNFAATGNGLDITTTTGSGFLATGGGTVSVTGAGNTITSGSATALNVSNTTIGASDLNFVSIASNGGTTGILLNNTGSSGGLTVTGTGSAGSGGTIQNKTARGIDATSTRDLSISWMNLTNSATTDSATNCANLSLGGNSNLGCNAPIHIDTVTNATFDRVVITNSAQQGINGRNVSGFVLTNSSLTGIGNAADEDGIHFLNMSGTSSITNTSVTGSFDDNLIVQNLTGTGTLTISGSTFSNSTQGSGILFGIRGTANSTINIQGGTQSTNNSSGGIVADTFENSTMVLNVSNSTSSGNNDQLSVSAGDNSNVDLNASNNTLTSVTAGSDFVAVSLLGSALDNGYTFDARIQNNIITTNNNVTADGLIAFNAGGGVMNMVIANNTFDYGGSQNAINIQPGQDGAGTTNATVQGNNIDIKLDGTSNAQRAMMVQVAVASPSGDNSTLCADIGSTTPALKNTITHSLGGTLGAGGDIRFRQRFVTTFRIPGYGGANNDNTAVVNHIVARNNLVNSPAATATNEVGVTPGAQGFVNTAGSAPCTQPNPIAPPAEEEKSAVLGDLQRSINDLLAFVISKSVSADLPATSADLPTTSAELPRTSADLPTISAQLPTTSAELAAVSAEAPTASAVIEMLGVVGQMISPTVYSQDIKLQIKSSESPLSGETVTTTPTFTIPAGKNVVIKYRATVDSGPYAAGVHNIDNVATVSGTNPFSVNSTTASIPLDAAPNLSITATDGSAVTEPGLVAVYTLNYANATGANLQATSQTRLSVQVPVNTSYNAASSGSGWSCADGAVNPTICTNDVGALATGGNGTKAIAFNINLNLPATALTIVPTATIAENPLNDNGTDLNPPDNTATDTDQVRGIWLGGTSTDWAVNTNWSNNLQPGSPQNISIPSGGGANAPTVSSADVNVTNLFFSGKNLTIAAGRTVLVSGSATLAANNVTGAGTLELASGASISRSSGQVNCSLRKNFINGNAAPDAPQAVFVFPVGTATGYSPVTANVSGTSTGSLEVKANDGTAPSTPALADATTLDRYWQMTETGSLTADLTFAYITADVDGTEANYRMIRTITGSAPRSFANGAPCPGAGNPCVDAAANTIFAAGVQVFDNFWTAGEALAPTAANVGVSGRVLDRDGVGLSRARVRLVDQNGNIVYAMTNPFGYYRFIDVPAGQDYAISVDHKLFQFQTRIVSVTDELTEINFSPSGK